MIASNLFSPKKFENVFAISDIEIEMLKAASRFQEPVTIPRRVTLLSKKHRPHVVIDTDHIMPLPIEKRHRLRTDQPA
jgi:hypothetical protein